MSVESFYKNENSNLTVEYAVDIELEKKFANLWFYDDLSRVVYSSSVYALRKRSRINDGPINFPFCNYRIEESTEGDRTWWNAKLYHSGYFVKELGMKLRLRPIILTYEGTFWCQRDDELRFAFNKMMWDSDSVVMLEPKINLNAQELSLPARLDYPSHQYDPEYKENDWIEKNVLHTFTFNLEIKTYAIENVGGICIPDEVIFDFAYNHDASINNIDDAKTFLIDHLNEEIAD